MFRADIFIVHGVGQLLSLADDTDHFCRHGQLAGAFDRRDFLQQLFQAGLEHGDVSVTFRENRIEQAFRFFVKPMSIWTDESSWL